MSAAPRPRVALVGASGFIGLRAAELLGARSDLSLIPLVRLPSSLAVLARQRHDWRITSFVEVDPLAAALKDCTTCIHAAIGDAAQIVRMADTTYRACAAAGVRRLIWLSSASVHGQNCPPGTDETTPLQDNFPLAYNNAKVRAEWALEKLARDRRVEVIRFRPGVVFGPRSRWIADVAADLQARRAGWLNGGRGICNSIYIDNLIDAIRLAVFAPAPLSGAFLLGDRETVTWRDFLLPIARHLGFDESAFAELPIPAITPEREGRLSAFTQTPAYGRIGRVVPARLKRLLKGAVRAWPEPAATQGAWILRTPVPPHLTPELALLQQCTWKLPHTLATRQLGYVPPITFAEGLSRSLAWLDFAAGR